MPDTQPLGKSITFAISYAEYQKFGCPVCGFATGRWCFMGGGGLMLSCENEVCKSTFFILHGNNKSFRGISFGNRAKGNFNPELKTHPRKNTPVWGKREDKTPPKTGEFFMNPSQSDYEHGLCFICKAPCRLPVEVEWPMKNLFCISFEASCEKAAKRIESEFNKMDLFVNLTGREYIYPPSFYFVTVSSCFTHRPNLLELQKNAKEKGVINKTILSKIKALK